MSSEITPSPIVQCFVQTVRDTYPPGEVAKLDTFDDAVAGTTSAADAQRAKRCVEWAVAHSDDQERPHPRWAELHERLHAWHEEWIALEFGVVGPQGTERHPIVDVRIEQTEAAVEVAQVLGEHDGWANSPWEALLGELIDMEKAGTDKR
jgi:hypothetical protein